MYNMSGRLKILIWESIFMRVETKGLIYITTGRTNFKN